VTLLSQAWCAGLPEPHPVCCLGIPFLLGVTFSPENTPIFDARLSIHPSWTVFSDRLITVQDGLD
jgi:hypothetical protein